jgi:hypothetical protein
MSTISPCRTRRPLPKPQSKSKQKLSEKYKITNLGSACQFLSIETHCEDNGTSLDPNIKLDLAEDRGEKELEDISDY